MKTIPQVRNELLDIAANVQDKVLGRKIYSLVKQLHRRPAVRRAAIEHAKMTPELSIRIKRYAELHPRMSYATIGLRYNVSNGRVSEVVAGKRAA